MLPLEHREQHTSTLSVSPGDEKLPRIGHLSGARKNVSRAALSTNERSSSQADDDHAAVHDDLDVNLGEKSSPMAFSSIAV